MLNQIFVAQSPSFIAPVGLGSACLIAALWPMYRRAARPAARDVCFGVTVPPGWVKSAEAAAITARYRQYVTAGSIVSLALVGLSIIPIGPVVARVMLGTLAPLLQTATVTIGFILCRRSVLPYSASPDTIRRATLDRQVGPTLGRWVLSQAGPLGVIALSSLFLVACWSAVPEQYATRFDAAGHPLHWVRKSPAAVFTPVLIGVLTCGLIFLFGAVTIHSGRRLRSTGRADAYLTTVLHLTLFGEYLSAVVMSAISWLPALVNTAWATLPMKLALGVLPASAVVIAYFSIVRWPALNRAIAAEQDGSADRFWRWGLLYANPSDPALLVPKRFGFGYTFNFARGGTWLLVAGTALYLLAVITLPLLTGRR